MIAGHHSSGAEMLVQLSRVVCTSYVTLFYDAVGYNVSSSFMFPL